jgi:hypothetical protein
MTTGLKVMLVGLAGAAIGFVATMMGATAVGPIIGFASCVVGIGGIVAHQMQKDSKDKELRR